MRFFFFFFNNQSKTPCAASNWVENQWGRMVDTNVQGKKKKNSETQRGVHPCFFFNTQECDSAGWKVSGLISRDTLCQKKLPFNRMTVSATAGGAHVFANRDKRPNRALGFKLLSSAGHATFFYNTNVLPDLNQYNKNIYFILIWREFLLLGK